MHAKGKRTDTMRSLNPRVARCFSLYLGCRALNFVHMELTKDKGKKVEHKIMPFVTGWSVLPEEGGLLDQGVWMMSMFEVFRAGENAGVRENNSL